MKNKERQGEQKEERKKETIKEKLRKSRRENTGKEAVIWKENSNIPFPHF